MRPHRVQSVLVEGFRHALEDMAKVIIATRSESDPDAIQVFDETASNLEAELMGRHRSQAEYGSVTLRTDLLSDTRRRVIIDVQRRIIGTEPYVTEKTVAAININNSHAAVAVNSAGATVQSSEGDASHGAHTLDTAVVTSALADLKRAVDAAFIENRKSMNAAVDSLQAEVEASAPDSSAIRQSYEWLRSKADKAADGGILAAVTALGRSIFG
jgi:hypothetical protein